MKYQKSYNEKSHNMENKEWIIGYEKWRDKIIKYYTIEEAAIRADVYKIIVASSLRIAKEQFVEDMGIGNEEND